MERMMALYVASKVSVVKPQFDTARAFMTLRALDAIAGMRAECEVGVQRDTQNFRGSVQLTHHITNSHFRVESGLAGVESEQCHSGFLGSNGGVPWFEAVLGGICAQRLHLHDGWEEEPVQYFHCRAQQ